MTATLLFVDAVIASGSKPLSQRCLDFSNYSMQSTRGAYDTIGKRSELGVGNSALSLIIPPAIGEIRFALPQARNPRVRCRAVAPREPLFLLQSSVLAGLVHPA